jgi:hypothetical protein
VTATVSSQCSSETSWVNGPMWLTPPLLPAISSLPSSLCDRSNAASNAARSATSAARAERVHAVTPRQLRGGGTPVVVDLEHPDVCPCLRELIRDRKSQANPGAGHERDSVVEVSRGIIHRRGLAQHNRLRTLLQPPRRVHPFTAVSSSRRLRPGRTAPPDA